MTALDLQPPPPKGAPLRELQRQLAQRLAALRARLRRRLFFEAMTWLLCSAVALAALSLLLDWWLHLSLPARLVYLAAAAVVLSTLALRWFTPLRQVMDPLSLAAAIELTGGERQGFTSRVATVLQLPALLDDVHAPSPAMVELAVRSSARKLERIRFEAHLDPHQTRRSAALLAAALVLPLAFATISPDPASLWARRWFAGSSQPWPRQTYLEVAGLSDGRIVVARGEPFTLRITSRPGTRAPDTVNLRYRTGGAAWSSATLARYADGDYRHEFPAVHEDTRVRVAGGDDAIGPFLIHPVDRPRITSIELVAQHPSQPTSQRHSFTGHDADPAFLPRTQMRLALAASVPIAEAHLGGAAAGVIQLHRVDEQHFVAQWTHQQPVKLLIELMARESGLSSAPMPVSVGLKTDQPPRATLRSTGVRNRVTPQARIPLIVQARDDYGVAAVGLAVRREPPDPDTAAPPPHLLSLSGPTRPTQELEREHAHVLELAALEPAVGTLVSLTAQAEDDCFTGAQTGHSRVLGFRVVPAEELFREILLRLQGERSRFRRSTDEAQSIREQMDIAVDAAAFALLSRRHRALQRETTRAQSVLGDALTEMKLNGLGGPELHEMLQRSVLTPLKSLQEGLMAPQRDALDRLGQNYDAQLAADAGARQEQITEQMRDILRQMAQWDSFVDVLNQLNEIIKLQERVKERTEKLRQTELEDLFKPKDQ